ncbi:MAG: 1-phosphofructokinase family hexose kinase [Fimbriimonas sp.]
MILSVTLNPSIDHALFVKELVIGDTNRVQNVETDAGGKGVNLSRVVAELGGQTVATGFLGGSTGMMVQGVLERQGVGCAFIEVAGETRTNFSVEDDAKGTPTTFNQKGPQIELAEFQALLAKVASLANNARWVAMGGSLPPGVPGDAFAQIGAIATAAGCSVMIDADGEAQRLGLACRPQFIKPNTPETARLLGRTITTEEEAIAAARDLLGFVQADGFAVLSRGKAGAILVSDAGVWLGRSPEVVTHSTIGSGDSLIGAMLWGLETGKTLPEAFQWGLAAGAATAFTDGSEIARRPMIEELLPRAIVTPV